MTPIFTFFQPNSDFFATGSSFRDGKHTKMIVRSWRIERKKTHCSPIISRRAGGFGRLRKAKPRKVRFFQTPLPGHWIDELNNWKDRNVHRYRFVWTELFPGHSELFFYQAHKIICILSPFHPWRFLLRHFYNQNQSFRKSAKTNVS